MYVVNTSWGHVVNAIISELPCMLVSSSRLQSVEVKICSSQSEPNVLTNDAELIQHGWLPHGLQFASPSLGLGQY